MSEAKHHVTITPRAADPYWCDVQWEIDGETGSDTVPLHRKVADYLREPYRHALARAADRHFAGTHFVGCIGTKRTKTVSRRLISGSYEKVAYPPSKIMVSGELFSFGHAKVAEVARRVGVPTWHEFTAGVETNTKIPAGEAA